MAGRHSPTPEGPVFVDPSGHRSTAVRAVGWLVASLVVGYVLLVAVTLIGPPGLSRVTVPGLGPVLPGPGAAPLDDGGPEREAPGAVLERTRPTQPSPAPTRAPASPSPTGIATSTPTARPSPTAGPTGTPTQAATPSATATPRRTGPPSAQPRTTRPAPPGASRRPTRSPS